MFIRKIKSLVMFEELTLLQDRSLTGFEKYSKKLLYFKSTILLTSAPAFLLGVWRTSYWITQQIDTVQRLKARSLHMTGIANDALWLGKYVYKSSMTVLLCSCTSKQQSCKDYGKIMGFIILIVWKVIHTLWNFQWAWWSVLQDKLSKCIFWSISLDR